MSLAGYTELSMVLQDVGPEQEQLSECMCGHACMHGFGMYGHACMHGFGMCGHACMALAYVTCIM